MSDSFIWFKSKHKHIKSTTCQGANGHPTPDHFGNMRGEIPHPKDFRTEYSMWTSKHVKDASPYYSRLLINARSASAASLGDGLGSCSTCIICHLTHATYKQASPFIVREMQNLH
jgi:hypothetical protein